MTIYIQKYLIQWIIAISLVHTRIQIAHPCKITSLINVTAYETVVLNATLALDKCFIMWYKSPTEGMCQYNASHAMKASSYNGKLNYTCTFYTLTILNANSSATGMYYTLGAPNDECVREKICYKVQVQFTVQHEAPIATQISPLLQIEPSMSESTIIWYVFLASVLLIIMFYLAKNAHSYWKHGHYHVPQIWWIHVEEPQLYRSMVS
ncbi:Rh28 [macacine betaherpesvirus 3]|nr:Rh28 [macacine betaherpesvirus 3]